MLRKSLACEGRCGAALTWDVATGDRAPTKSDMEQYARNKGWQAPDKAGRHWCLNCRRPEGAAAWWRKENVRLGLSAGYGLGKCRCDHAYRSDSCVSAGHPGVVSRL